MRAARPERLPGGAAGASLALHLGAGLWLALGGAVPGSPPARQLAGEVPIAFATLAKPAQGEARESPGAAEAWEPALAEAETAPPEPFEEAQPMAGPAVDPVPEAPPLAEAPPEPIPEPAARAEASPTPSAPPPGEAAPVAPSAPPRPPRPAHRPKQALGPGAPREPATDGGAAIAAMPVAAAATNPGPPPVITQARYRQAPTPPAYPPRAIAFRMAGTALVRALIGPDGQTREVRLHRSSGHAVLDQAALAAVRGWAFAAASEGGRPIDAWVEVPVRFHLDD